MNLIEQLVQILVGIREIENTDQITLKSKAMKYA